jgi:hypothetical protein
MAESEDEALVADVVDSICVAVSAASREIGNEQAAD